MLEQVAREKLLGRTGISILVDICVDLLRECLTWVAGASGWMSDTIAPTSAELWTDTCESPALQDEHVLHGRRMIGPVLVTANEGDGTRSARKIGLALG